jgi:hypothetical protein
METAIAIIGTGSGNSILDERYARKQWRSVNRDVRRNA